MRSRRWMLFLLLLALAVVMVACRPESPTDVQIKKDLPGHKLTLTDSAGAEVEWRISRAGLKNLQIKDRVPLRSLNREDIKAEVTMRDESGSTLNGTLQIVYKMENKSWKIGSVELVTDTIEYQPSATPTPRPAATSDGMSTEERIRSDATANLAAQFGMDQATGTARLAQSMYRKKNGRYARSLEELATITRMTGAAAGITFVFGSCDSQGYTFTTRQPSGESRVTQVPGR